MAGGTETGPSKQETLSTGRPARGTSAKPKQRRPAELSAEFGRLFDRNAAVQKKPSLQERIRTRAQIRHSGLIFSRTQAHCYRPVITKGRNVHDRSDGFARSPNPCGI
ncbi:hypothetical protein [Rhizobium sp. Leaf371]|uniref:hypothetical protein n=1 Tax=Rhizobium sp. Leaf371 TaxID=1736355 RepID=UPI0012E7D280|nr:hypothetical protein [Rhizobium sp. Leaf371]